MSSSFIGKVLDNYRILERLGIGGMGVVFKANHIKLDKVFAIKIIAPGLAMNEHFIKRFQTEAKALAKFEDPNIVRIYDLRTFEDQWFIVMEYVEGTTLTEKILKDGAYHWVEALPIIKQVLSAVGHAHEAGIIHRDIKPSNILINDKGLVKITDFGLAKDQTQNTNTVSVTSGGTLYYMSPEHVKGFSFIDARSDLYSVGMTFYEMLTGIVPFQHIKSDFDLRESIIRKEFDKPRSINPTIPVKLESIIMKSIKKSPDDRYQTADDMMKAILDFEAEVGLSEKKSEEKTVRSRNVPVPPTEPAKISDIPLPAESTDLVLPEKKHTLIKLTGVFSVLAVIIFVLLRGWIFTDSLSSPAELPAKTLLSRLTISSTPAAAWIIINGDSVGKTPLKNHAIAAGQYALKISKDHYNAVDTTISLAEDIDLGMAFTLQSTENEQPLTASQANPPRKQMAVSSVSAELSVQSDPSGSEIWVDGKYKGITPLRLSKIAPGSYQLEMRLEGYENYTRDLDLVAGNNPRISAELKPFTGGLSITKDPQAAKILVDGKEVNSQKAPVANINSIPVGKHLIEVSHAGYASYKQTIEIKRNEITAITANLVRNEGDLSIQIRPWGSIYINGQLQKSSADIKYTVRLPVEHYDLKIEHPTLGVWQKRVEIMKDKESALMINFTKQIAIQVKAVDDQDNPLNGEIFVDGQSTGQVTPGAVSVRIGMHRIGVKKVGYVLDGGDREVLIDSGMDNILVFNLKKTN